MLFLTTAREICEQKLSAYQDKCSAVYREIFFQVRRAYQKLEVTT